MQERHLEILDSASREGVKPGLERIRVLTDGIGVPPVIHIAGTNGKGSTAIMTEAILQEHGLAVGTYTQPHIVDPTERIRIDGHDISEDGLAEVLDGLSPRIGAMADRPTYFEVFTAAAVLAFSRAGVGVAVLETGMGGRLDATNLFPKRVACITRVAIDHAEVLGQTIREIAGEKAAIITPGIDVVTGATGDALDVIEEAARKAGTPVKVLGRDIIVEFHDTSFSVVTGKARYDGMHTSMPGSHQAENAALAVACAEAFYGPLDVMKVRTALDSAWLPGRFQGIDHQHRRIIFDVAHNPDAAAALASTLKAEGREPDATVFAAMREKDIPGVLAALPNTRYILTTVGASRSADRVQLDEAADGIGLGTEWVPEPEEALERAIALTREGDTILVTGSGYLVGRVLSHLEE